MLLQLGTGLKSQQGRLFSSGLASLGAFPLISRLTHSDRLRDWPLDAGATIEANPFGKVPTPAKTPACFREMSDQEANLMDLVILSLLCRVSG
jgi:hypothetical protein